ncbi:hypothetical protein [Promicromonospora iranensis]|uniref:hypothetical protein n=1 Tax=Promicromonospora iranensis TaxID=1105144 RepID=UPI0023A9B1B0|nr:hypothetical protein [Promicromonospora iranensis]
MIAQVRASAVRTDRLRVRALGPLGFIEADDAMFQKPIRDRTDCGRVTDITFYAKCRGLALRYA